jgi:hypothetical protein
MKFRVQTYCEADGVPSPTEPQSIIAADMREAAEKIAGGKLLAAGPHGKLAAMVWRQGEFNPRKIPFYRP